MASTRTRRPTARPPAAVVEAPPELLQALKDDPIAREAYRAMPPSHRRAYADFIEDAKRTETRVRRTQQALRMITQWGVERGAKKSAKQR